MAGPDQSTRNGYDATLEASPQVVAFQQLPLLEQLDFWLANYKLARQFPDVSKTMAGDYALSNLFLTQLQKSNKIWEYFCTLLYLKKMADLIFVMANKSFTEYLFP